jgi:hypothetical protein
MRVKCEEVEQLSLSLENRPGVLADLCAHLSDHHINIRAISVLENTNPGTVRLVVDNVESARRALVDAGVEFSSAKCLALVMPNCPGGFGGIARTLSLAGINIDYIYASAAGGTAAALGVLHVSDLKRALALDWEG